MMDMEKLFMPKEKEWTAEKIVRCMKEIIHEEMFPDINVEDFKGSVIDLQNFMDYLYREWPQKMLYYGLPQQLEVILMGIRKIPEIHKDPKVSYEDFKNQSHIDLSFAYSDENESSVTFLSKQDLCQSLQQYFEHPILFDRTKNLSPMFCSEYVHMFAYEKYQKLEGTYQLESQNEYLKILFAKEFVEYKGNVDISRETFENLRKYYTKSETSFNILMNIFDNWNEEKPIEKNQEWYIEQYVHILGTIQKMEKYESALSPRESLGEYPVIRVFTENQLKFVLSKELEDALRIAMRKKYPEKIFPEGLVNVESENDRKLGILNALKNDTFYKIIKIIGLTPKDLNIVIAPIQPKFHGGYLPIISTYGKHCLFSDDAFRQIMQYLSKILKVFQRCKKDKLPKIFDWINVNLIKLFSARKSRYLIETWKIKEIINQARRDLSVYITNEPFYQVPDKVQYTKDEVLNNVRKLLGANIQFSSQLFETFYQHLDQEGYPFIYHDIYELYHNFVVHTINYQNMEFMGFITNQISMFVENDGQSAIIVPGGFESLTTPSQSAAPPEQSSSSNLPKSEPKKEEKKEKDEEFSCFKKGFLKSKRLEVVDNIVNHDKKKINMSDFDAAANHVIRFSAQTLAYFSNEEFRPISEFKSTIEEHFRDFFRDPLWNILKSVFEDEEEMKRLMKCIDHLYETKDDPKLGFMFKKLKVYKVDPMQRKLLQEIEDEEMIKVNNIRLEKENQKLKEGVKTENSQDLEKVRKELEETKNEKLKLSEILKSLRKELENQKRRFQEDNSKIAENLKNSENAKLAAENELKKSREDNSKLVENLKNYNDSKLVAENDSKKYREENIELAEKLENSENAKLASENELKRSREENVQLSQSLKNSEISKSAAENELKRLSGNLKEKEDELATVTMELEKMKMKNGNTPRTENLDEFEKWFEEGFEKLKLMKRASSSKSQEKLEKYERILRTDYDEIIDRLSANINEILRKSRNSSEVRNLKKEVDDFDENYDDYLKKVRREIRRIRENGEVEKEENIEEFPGQEFMKKYQKLVEEYGLEL